MRFWNPLFSRRKRDDELDEEVQTHLRMAAQERMGDGESVEQASTSALREFGNVLLVKEVTRSMWGWGFWETCLQDLRYGLRMLAKNPGFTGVAVLTFALGVGANTAIFSVVYAVLLRPLPFKHPEQLVRLYDENRQAGVMKNGASYVDYEEWRKQNHVFSELAGVQVHDLTLTGQGEPSTVQTVVVTPELFSLLEAKPLAGRVFAPADGDRGAAPMVIVSEGLWRNRLGSDPAIVGHAINLDKRAFTVVGIMPADFRFPLLNQTENIWIPLVQDPLFGSWTPRRGGHWLGVIGRLKPGVTMAQAQAEMASLSARLAAASPADDAGWTVRIATLQSDFVGNVKPALLVLMGAVGLVLLIACVNIANLLLTRATSRESEIALRLALGAGRSRIIRQLLTESAALGILGGIAGILLAFGGTRALMTLLPAGLPQIHVIRVDRWVAGFALVLSAVAGFVSGLAPALFATESAMYSGLKEGGRSLSSGRREGVRRALAVAEIALAMLLLVGAGLLLRSFAALSSVDPGFRVRNILKAEISLPRFEYSTPQQWAAFSRALMARIQAQPGLQDSAAAVPPPLADGFVNLNVDIAGAPPLPPGKVRTADYVAITPQYFRVMEIPLLRGRTFNAQDAPSSPAVTVISAAFAQMYFPGEDPIGKRLVFGFPPNPGVPREIVGVVGDVRDASLSREPGPMMYVPFDQAPFWGQVLMVRTSLPPETIAAAIRQEVRIVDKDLPVTDIETMPEAVESSLAQPRFRTWLLSLFGAMALALATVGVFGMVSYSVARRTHEIGIRMALGAVRGDVLKMVVAQGLKLTLAGVGLGAAGALGMTRWLSSLLYGVKPADPLTFMSVSVILTAAALLASYIPARRATKVEPLVALRYE